MSNWKFRHETALPGLCVDVHRTGFPRVSVSCNKIHCTRCTTRPSMLNTWMAEHRSLCSRQLCPSEQNDVSTSTGRTPADHCIVGFSSYFLRRVVIVIGTLCHGLPYCWHHSSDVYVTTRGKHQFPMSVGLAMEAVSFSHSAQMTESQRTSTCLSLFKHVYGTCQLEPISIPPIDFARRTGYNLRMQ